MMREASVFERVMAGIIDIILLAIVTTLPFIFDLRDAFILWQNIQINLSQWEELLPLLQEQGTDDLRDTLFSWGASLLSLLDQGFDELRHQVPLVRETLHTLIIYAGFVLGGIVSAMGLLLIEPFAPHLASFYYGEEILRIYDLLRTLAPDAMNKLTHAREFILSLPFMAGLAVRMLYFGVLLSSPWRATVGMRLMNCRMVADDGYDMNLTRGILWFWLQIFTVLSLGLGYLWIFMDKRKRVLHDILAHVAVVKPAVR